MLLWWLFNDLLGDFFQLDADGINGATGCALLFFYFFVIHFYLLLLPSVLWHCWFCIRKSIRPVKNWVMMCWRDYLSGVRCRWFAYGPAGATTTSSSFALLKSRMVSPFWCRLTQVVLVNKPLSVCMSVCFFCCFSRKLEPLFHIVNISPDWLTEWMRCC